MMRVKYIAGHGRVEAAKQLRMKTVPCVRSSHLSESDKRTAHSQNQKRRQVANTRSDRLSITPEPTNRRPWAWSAYNTVIPLTGVSSLRLFDVSARSHQSDSRVCKDITNICAEVRSYRTCLHQLIIDHLRHVVIFVNGSDS